MAWVELQVGVSHLFCSRRSPFDCCFAIELGFGAQVVVVRQPEKQLAVGQALGSVASAVDVASAGIAPEEFAQSRYSFEGTAASLPYAASVENTEDTSETVLVAVVGLLIFVMDLQN